MVAETSAEMPAATPSRPSMRFIAFVISTNQTTVTTGSNSPRPMVEPPGSVNRPTWKPVM